MGSGDDLVSGQYNGFESTTTLGAQLPDPPAPFNGDFILVVAPLPNDPPFTPQQTLSGILGLGTNGTIPSLGSTGVVGCGGPNQGTGVLGQGGGSRVGHGNGGSGGTGVSGQGGDGALRTFGPKPVDPGTGVTGSGGLQDKFETTGKPHGAGVVGVAGNGPVPPFMDAGSVGVFGQGGNAARITVQVDGVKRIAGPKDPGIGVLGKGGTQSDDGVMKGPGGAGVVGVAGGTALPSSSDWGDAGVFGTSRAGRGGVFESATMAQLLLVPVVNPTPALPGIGVWGDLYVNVTGSIEDSTATVNMYLCVSPGDGTAGNLAQWAPFQFGPSVSGG